MNLEALAQEIEEDAEELISVAKGNPARVLGGGLQQQRGAGEQNRHRRLYESGQGAVRPPLRKVCRKHKMILAAQCCEHLNRALVVDQKPWKNSAGSR